MAIRIVVGLLWLGLFSAYYAATITNPKDTSQILLVVSFDSFNSKYLEKNLSPNLKLFQEEGASVPYLKNVFPTKTLPNHFSIATGTYPDKHGVVNNEILDKTLGKSVRYGQEYYHMDNAVTPIWVSYTFSYTWIMFLIFLSILDSQRAKWGSFGLPVFPRN